VIRAGRLVLVAGAIVCSSSVVFDRDASAAPLTVTLEYASSPGCPDAADFKAVVIARLGYDPFTDGASDHVLVDIQRRGSAIDGHIEWRDFSGRWTGDQSFPSVSTDCPRLVRAMGFALAVQIQLLAKANAPSGVDADAPAARPAAPEAPAVVAPPPAPERPAVVSVAAEAPRSTPAAAPPVFAMGAGPSVGLGMSSGPVLLGRVFGALAWQHISIELAGMAGLPATTRRADGAGFSQQHLLGSLAACAAVTRWNGCLLANAGVVRMNGEIDRPASATVPIVEVGLRAGLTQRLGRTVSLAAHADGLVNVTRWTGRLDQVPVWTAPRFAAALGVDARVQFP
jgi:hypothetical protein